MAVKFWLSKFIKYYRSKGLLYTLRRCVRKIDDLMYSGSYILFSADLTKISPQQNISRADISVKCCKGEADISSQDRKILSAYLSEERLQHDIEERFTRGALLWLVKVEGVLAGYIWTIRGATIEPYVFPLVADDVHFFDNLIFEEFRGRGINPVLVNYVLDEMQRQRCARALIETRTTNIAETRSLAKTGFNKYGIVKKNSFLKRGYSGIWRRIKPISDDFKDLKNEEQIEMQIFEGFEQLLGIQPEWDLFVEATCGDIFLTYDWCRIWWKYYGGNKTLKIFVFRCKGKLVGLLPTYIDKIGISPFAVKVARILCTTFVLAEEVNPPIAGEHMRQVLEKWLEHLYLEFSPDIVCIGPVHGTHDNADRFVRDCALWGGQRFVVDKRDTGFLTMFHLGASMEEYLASLSGKERHETNRHCRNILKILPDKNAGIVTEDVSDSKLHNELDEFIRMHNHQWQLLKHSGHFNDWSYSKEFNHEIAESQLKHGRLRFFKISIGQTCIDYEYAYKFARTYFHYLNARTSAKEFRRVAVGKVVFCEFVKKAIAENVNLINSMRGRYEYKMRMGGVLEPAYAVLIYRKGLIAHIRVHIFRCFSRLIRICYYKLWFSRIAPKMPWRRGLLWDIWIKTNAFAR